MVPLICKLVVSFPDHTRKKKIKKLSQARFLIKKLARGVFVSPRCWKQVETFLCFAPVMQLFQTKSNAVTPPQPSPPPPRKVGSVKRGPHVRIIEVFLSRLCTFLTKGGKRQITLGFIRLSYKIILRCVKSKFVPIICSETKNLCDDSPVMTPWMWACHVANREASWLGSIDAGGD